MCLISNSEIPLISTSDIVCYKILISINGKLFTPYRDFIFPLEEIVIDKKEEKISEIFNHYMIESGYFHSYKTIEVAKKEVDKLKRKLPKGKVLKIYKSYIPTGTSFFEGQFEDLCSKALRIMKECCD